MEEENKEESELEKEIEEEEEDLESEEDTPRSEEFNEFFEQPIESSLIETSSPSLEKINSSSENPIRLEMGVAGSSFKKEEEEEGIKYGTELYKEEESKYQNDGIQTVSPERVEMENLGRNDLFQRQNVGLTQSNEIPKSQEEYIKAESQKIEELGRNENPFEPKAIKYKPVK